MSPMTLHEFDRENVCKVLRAARSADADELRAQVFNDGIDALADNFLRSRGFKFCLGLPGEPVACVGVEEIHPRVWQAWMFATDDFPLIAGGVTRFIRRHVIPAVERLDAHRCHAIAAQDNTPACRWLEVLGAKKEAILARYGRDGETFVMYRWDRRVQN